VGIRAEPAPFQGASIALAYLRGWGWLAVLFLGVYAFCAPSDRVSLPSSIALALAAVLGLEGWIAGWWVGRRQRNRLIAALTLTLPAFGLAAGLWFAFDDHPEIIRRHCDAGVATACADLAHRYEIGMDVRRDPALATELYARACTGGIKQACEARVKP
jgi:hypothetical protein